MADKIPEVKIKLFEVIVRSFTIAIKCSALYAITHPSVENSIKSFKENLDKWLDQEESLNIGIAADNLLLNQEFVREASELFAEVADYLHQRGLVAISFLKGVTLNELISFFTIIRNEPKFFTQNGGIVKNISKVDFIQIKEIDYSSLLNASDEGTVTLEDKNIWQQLTSIGSNLQAQELPESSFEFIMDFLKDQKKSAPLLNKIYKDALQKLEGKSMVDSFRGTFENMVKYLKNKPKNDSRAIKAELAQILSNLNPDFVANVFVSNNPQTGAADLSKDFFNDLSDDEIANFMASLMSNEGKVSENLFKLFDKLAPKSKGTGNLAVMLTDKLLEKKLIKKDALTDLQTSIKHIFEANSDNEFMSQMYKLTVETLVDQGSQGQDSKNIYAQLVSEYENSLSQENMEKSKIDLVLNLLWLESDPGEYKKFSDILLQVLDKFNSPEYIQSFKEAFEYFNEKIKPEQRANPEISRIIDEAKEKLYSPASLCKIIALIPGLDALGLDAVAYIIGCSKGLSGGLVLDAFMNKKDDYLKDKFITVINKTGVDISENILNKLSDTSGLDKQSAKDLFKILKESYPSKAREIARNFIQSPDEDIRNYALDGFIPQNDEEINIIFNIFLKEGKEDSREKLLSGLVKSNDKNVLNKLFGLLQKKLMGSSYLVKCIRFCGDNGATEALPHLERIITLRPIFDTEVKKQLRISAVVSLAQIGTPEAMRLVEKSLTDQSDSVKKIAKLALDSYKENSLKQKGQ